MQNHRDFLRRQKKYERKYARVYFLWLQAVYRDAADQYEGAGSINEPDSFDEALEAIYTNLYTEVMLKEAKLTNADLKGQKDLLDDAAALYGGGSLLSYWKVILGTYLGIRIAIRMSEVKQTTLEFINQIIRKSIDEGGTIEETATEIRSKTGFNRNRSRLIARTETVTASNSGSHMAAQTSVFVREKRWIATNDKRTRDTHRVFLRKGWVPLDTDFLVPLPNSVGVEPAKYPGDITLSPANVCNCRCATIYRNKRDTEGNLIRKT